MVENASHDLLPLVENDKSVRILKGTASNQYVFRMNWLQPPFNNAKVRQAAFMALKQQEFLEAVVGNPKYWRTCKALFTCDSPLATEAGMDALLEGNSEKAGQMLKEAGYDGASVVLLQASDVGVLTNLAPVAKRQLERAGFKVEMQTMDWQSLINRLSTKKGPPSEGGWNAFATSWVQVDILDPLMTPFSRRIATRRAPAGHATRTWRRFVTTMPVRPHPRTRGASPRRRSCSMPGSSRIFRSENGLSSRPSAETLRRLPYRRR